MAMDVGGAKGGRRDRIITGGGNRTDKVEAIRLSLPANHFKQIIQVESCCGARFPFPPLALAGSAITIAIPFMR